MLEGSVIIIGDEILAGSVNDANGHLAAGRMREHGIPLTGVHVVPDDHGAIVGTLRGELLRPRPRLVVTSGGIGPTQDDVTFAAVAETLDQPLRLESEEVARLDDELGALRSRGFEVDDEVRDDILSMVRVPEAAVVLRHSGWVCGIRIEVDGGIDDDRGATIVALPGVPGYFRTVLDDLVVPALLAGRGRKQKVGELPHRLPEVVVSAHLKRVAARWPDVRLGSYPGDPMVVRAFGPPASVDAVIAELAPALADLESGADQPS